MKNKKKMKKLFWNFVCSYLRIGWHDLLHIWYANSPSSGASLQQIWLNLGKWSQSLIRRCENYILCFPVNILIVWHDGFLGCMTHYSVSWSSQRYLPCVTLKVHGSLTWLKQMSQTFYLTLNYYQALRIHPLVKDSSPDISSGDSGDQSKSSAFYMLHATIKRDVAAMSPTTLHSQFKWSTLAEVTYLLMMECMPLSPCIQ